MDTITGVRIPPSLPQSLLFFFASPTKPTPTINPQPHTPNPPPSHTPIVRPHKTDSTPSLWILNTSASIHSTSTSAASSSIMSKESWNVNPPSSSSAPSSSLSSSPWLIVRPRSNPSCGRLIRNNWFFPSSIQDCHHNCVGKPWLVV